MLKLNKKYLLPSGIAAGVFLLLFLFFKPALAINTNVRQVKLSNSPTVYFLSHGAHVKKPYVNAASYLGYGNRWSDIRIVSAADLNSWPDAKLFKTADSPDIYYISGARKTKILSPDDLNSFSLAQEPVLTVGATDLAQYQDATYSDLGLSSASGITVFNDLVTGNNNSVIAGTDGNLLASFRFRAAGGSATVTDLLLDITGVYNSAVLKSAFFLDGDNNAYETNVSVNANQRKIYVHFRPGLALTVGQDKTVKVLLNLGICSTCSRQTIRATLVEAASVTADQPVEASWPLTGTEFTIISGSTIVGQPSVAEQSLAGANLVVSNGSRLIGKFTFSEASGNEDVLAKQMIISNAGTANIDDWQDFRLLNDNQVVARVDKVDTDGRIIFNISYFRFSHSQPVTLTVVAGLKSAYRHDDTFDLNLDSLWSTGKTYGYSLSANISNLSESFPLN